MGQLRAHGVWLPAQIDVELAALERSPLHFSLEKDADEITGTKTSAMLEDTDDYKYYY